MRTNVKNIVNMILCIALLCVVSVFALPASAASGDALMEQEQILQLVNMERAKAGVSAVSIGSENLNAAANARAEELSHNYSYVRPNGKREFTILNEYNVSEISVGEDYWAGCETAEEAVSAWMNNDYFRTCLLNAEATHIGVGHFKGGAYQNYWVIIFTYTNNTSNSEFASQVLALVNAERAKAGLAALEMGDANLTAAAQARAEEIAEVNSHVRPNGSSCFTVLKEFNVTEDPTGENAAWGEATPEEVVADWMASEGHRANILDPEAHKMSVGYYYSSSSAYGHQWVQLFTK